MFKHILLPTDGTDLSAIAVKQAVKLARSTGAKLTAINVTPEYPYVAYEESSVRVPASVKKQFFAQAAEGSNKLLENVKTVARASGVDCSVVSVHSSKPYDAIIKQAGKSKCDLIMMASHGRGGMAGILLGSETSKVLSHSRIPVLVVR